MNEDNNKLTLSEVMYALKHLPMYIIRKKKKNKKELNKNKLTLHDFAEYYIKSRENNKSDIIDKIGWIVLICFILYITFIN